MVIINELENLDQEVGMAYFKVLSWHLRAGTEENDDNQHSNNQCTSQAKTGHLPFELTCLIIQHRGALCGAQAHFTSLNRRSYWYLNRDLWAIVITVIFVIHGKLHIILINRTIFESLLLITANLQLKSTSNKT
jgi:hypothetical protein